MAVIVDQKRLGGGSHSTVGTITDIYTLLRLLFSRVGQPHVGFSNAFSFNDPEGMCRTCNGLGKKLGVVYDDFIDRSKSLADGAIQVPFFTSWESGAYAASGLFDKNKKLSKFTREEMDLLLHSPPRKVKVRSSQQSRAPLQDSRPQHRRLVGHGNRRSRPGRLGHQGSGRGTDCGDADGAAAAVVDIGLEYLTLNRETDTLSGGESQRVRMVKHLGSSFFDHAATSRKLEAMRDVGLDYLTLGQPLSTLSGGECQRIKLASELHKKGSVYVLDEPTTGLHPSDVERLLAILDRLVDGGNSVIVIEHHMDVIRRADWIIDLGPEVGSKGGRIVFAGTPMQLLDVKESLTSQYLRTPNALAALV
jgi:excinuclease UvrABC ATPase subunit